MGDIREDPGGLTFGPVSFAWDVSGLDFDQFYRSVPAGGTPPFKVPTLTSGAGSVRLVVPELDRSNVGLLYDPAQFDKDTLSAGSAEVILENCPDEEFTTYNGGLLIRHPMCVRLEIYSGEDSRLAELPFGAEC
jgi:hypothetical protein